MHEAYRVLFLSLSLCFQRDINMERGKAIENASNTAHTCYYSD